MPEPFEVVGEPPELFFYECEDCHEEAVFLHRHNASWRGKPLEFYFCDKHSLRELRRDLHSMEHGRDVVDLIEVVLIP